MFRTRSVASLAAAGAIVVAVLIAGCGGSSTNASAPAAPMTSAGHTATIGAAGVGKLGKVLVDANGNTVYLFQKDTGPMSTCTGACAANWPPLRATGKPSVGSGLSAAKLGTTARSDGKPQVTYAGHPLYRYSGDSKPGDANGQGINAYGANWYVLSSSGAAVTTGGSGGSYGY